MLKFYVRLENSGGILDAQEVVHVEGTDPGEALKAAAIAMLQSCAYLQPGDKLAIVEA